MPQDIGMYMQIFEEKIKSDLSIQDKFSEIIKQVEIRSHETALSLRSGDVFIMLCYNKTQNGWRLLNNNIRNWIGSQKWATHSIPNEYPKSFDIGKSWSQIIRPIYVKDFIKTFFYIKELPPSDGKQYIFTDDNNLANREGIGKASWTAGSKIKLLFSGSSQPIEISHIDFLNKYYIKYYEARLVGVVFICNQDIPTINVNFKDLKGQRKATEDSHFFYRLYYDCFIYTGYNNRIDDCYPISVVKLGNIYDIGTRIGIFAPTPTPSPTPTPTPPSSTDTPTPAPTINFKDKNIKFASIGLGALLIISLLFNRNRKEVT